MLTDAIADARVQIGMAMNRLAGSDDHKAVAFRDPESEIAFLRHLNGEAARRMERALGLLQGVAPFAVMADDAFRLVAWSDGRPRQPDTPADDAPRPIAPTEEFPPPADEDLDAATERILETAVEVFGDEQIDEAARFAAESDLDRPEGRRHVEPCQHVRGV